MSFCVFTVHCAILLLLFIFCFAVAFPTSHLAVYVCSVHIFHFNLLLFVVRSTNAGSSSDSNINGTHQGVVQR